MSRQHEIFQNVLDVHKSVPGGGSDGAYTLDAESIFVVVLQGQLSLDVGGDIRILNTGDSTTFSARTPHNWFNPLSTESQVMWVISPPLPLVGEATTTANRDRG